MKYMGKTTDIFRRMKFWLPQNLLFQAKTCAAGRASKIELSMLVLDIVMISRLKIFDGTSVEFMESLDEDA